jgi:hypothetical protein
MSRRGLNTEISEETEQFRNKCTTEIQVRPEEIYKDIRIKVDSLFIE